MRASQALLCKQITWIIWSKWNFWFSWWGLHSAFLTWAQGVVMLLAGGPHLNSKLLHNTKGFSLPPSSYYHSHDNDDKSFKNIQQVNRQIMWNGWIRRMKWQQLCSLKNIHHAALIKSGPSPRQPLYSPGKKHKQNLISLGLKEGT